MGLDPFWLLRPLCCQVTSTLRWAASQRRRTKRPRREVQLPIRYPSIGAHPLRVRSRSADKGRDLETNLILRCS